MAEDSKPHTIAPPEQFEVTQPTRGAERNRNLVEHGATAGDEVFLPALDAGITLLDVEGGRGVSVLQALVLDQLLLDDGPAFWIDADGHATTTTLARMAPSRRLLDRIHVARGFTASQHYSAVRDLEAAVDQYIEETTNSDDADHRSVAGSDGASSRTPSLIVAPAIDAQYRGADTFAEPHATTLLARSLARLTAYATGYDVPVLVTRTTTAEPTTPVATAADHRLTCEHTRMGPRFVGDEFETLVYPIDDGAYVQTTFAYWRRLLGARAARLGIEPAGTPSPGDGSTAVGTGVTTDGAATSLTPNPALDAWIADAGGR